MFKKVDFVQDKMNRWLACLRDAGALQADLDAVKEQWDQVEPARSMVASNTIINVLFVKIPVTSSRQEMLDAQKPIIAQIGGTLTPKLQIMFDKQATAA